MKQRVRFIDPPSGWKYGFPKILPEGVEATNEWFVENGYPQSEIDSMGKFFYCRHWSQEIEMASMKEKLYKIDSKGKTRVWWIEYDEEKYRTHSGIDGGKIVISGWQYPSEKNVGKANATSVSEQVVNEVNAEYVKKQHQGKYHSKIEDTALGAKFVEAMLAQKYDPAKHTNFPYISQPKYDGVRCLVSKNGMFSRNGKPIISAPHIQEALSDFFEKHPNVVLDGELYNHQLKNDFEKIISLSRKSKPSAADLQESRDLIQYHVYDIVSSKTCVNRLEFLTETINEAYAPTIQLAESYFVDESQIQDRLAEYLSAGYEGQMLRDPNGIYESKRSRFLLKHKEFQDEEFEIISVVEGQGNWAGYAKSIEIRLKDGTTQYSGVRGSYDMLKDVIDNASEYVGGTATVIYQNKTEDGKLRFPVAKFLYKNGKDV